MRSNYGWRGKHRLHGLLGGFSPQILFAANEPGAWYDPSDLSTLYQDAAGTVPVTAAGQTVGLVLDKSKGLVLGPEEVTNGDNEAALFSTATGPSGTRGTVSRSTELGVAAAKFTADKTGAVYITPFAGMMIPAGKAVQISYRVYIPTAWTGSGIKPVDTSDNSFATTAVSIRDQWVFVSYIRPAKETAWLLRIGDNNWVDHTGQSFYIDDLSIRELPGNHATQATAASRPLLQQDATGRYYLLFDGTDDFLVTNTITPWTDKAQVFAGVRAVVAQTGLVLGFGASDSGVSGGFSLINSDGGTAFAAATHGGTVGVSRAVGSQVGVSYVFGLLFDHAQSGVANEITYRRNGTLPTTSDGGVDAGAGNYAANPLYIGRRGGTSLPFNGRLYGLITRFGSNLSDAQITQAESWLNGKTGAY